MTPISANCFIRGGIVNMNYPNCFLRLPKELEMKYKLSEYNVYLDESRGLVYNAVTQAVSEFEDKMLTADNLQDLVECGFIVLKGTDEKAVLRDEYRHRDEFSNELHLIIALTLDCQFRCVYCYEKHPSVYMNESTKRAVIDVVQSYAKTGKNISVVWYGGEPMLDFESVKTLTYEFQNVCNNCGVEYTASMISNGYAFNRENILELDMLSVASVQITVDGMKTIHELRRPMSNGEESFECIINNMIAINQNTNTEVHLRINVDKDNIQSAYELITYLKEIGLTEIDVNLGMMKAFGCDHVCGKETKKLFTMREFADEFMKFKEHLIKNGFYHAVEKMMPEYKVNSCTMDAPDSYVIDPAGYVYKCISKVGQRECSIGNVMEGFNAKAHLAVDAFEFEMCIRCKYFPICKGGCLMNNQHGHKECNIWKFVTERLIISDITIQQGNDNNEV